MANRGTAFLKLRDLFWFMGVASQVVEVAIMLKGFGSSSINLSKG